MPVIYLFIFLFGICFGSFANVLIYRLEKEEDFLLKRSYCPRCNHQLAWFDLIPLLSFLFLRGKCRYCKNQISFQYPLVELLTGFLFLAVFKAIFFSEMLAFVPFWFLFLSLVPYLILTVILVTIFVYDLKFYLISDGLITCGVITFLIYRILGWLVLKENILNFLLAGFFAGLFFYLIVFFSKEKWMGMGDAKLAFLMGIVLGAKNTLLALFSAFFLGAIIGIGLMLLKKKGLKSEIPFGPFLVSGTFISIIWGNQIINWYLSLLF